MGHCILEHQGIGRGGIHVLRRNRFIKLTIVPSATGHPDNSAQWSWAGARKSPSQTRQTGVVLSSTYFPESSTCPLKKGLPCPGPQVPPIFNRTGEIAHNRQVFSQNRQMALAPIPPCVQIPSHRRPTRTPFFPQAEVKSSNSSMLAVGHCSE